MRKLLWGLLAVTLFAGPSHAQSAVALQSAGSDTGGLASSVSVAFPQNTTAGNTIIVAIDAGDTVTQVTDTLRNNYVKDLGPIGGRSHFFRASNIAGGPDTVTATFSSSTYANIHIVEYSGLAPSSPLDGASGANGHSAAVNCASLTTSNPNDLLIVYARVKFTLASADSNYAATETSGNWMGDRRVSEAGTYSASFTQEPGGTFECLLAAYKTGSGGPGGGSPLQIASTTVPSGTVNLPYTTTLSASGGTAPYTWSVSSASLPPGLNLASTGRIDGTPTAAGKFPFTVQVGDSVGATATRDFHLAITTNPPADGSVESVQSAGTVLERSARSISMAFPLNTTTGNTIIVAIDAGDTVTQVTDTLGNNYVKDLGRIGGRSYFFRASNIAGGPDTVTANFSSLAHASIHIVEYSGLAPSSPLDGASGANGHDTAVNCASLTTSNPNDLLIVYARVKFTLASADSNYTATETTWNWMGDRRVSEAGTYSASFTQERGGTFECLLAAYKTGSGDPGGTPLQIATTTVPSGTVNLAYTTTLSATGGTAPYTWSVSSASLPSGLHLASTGQIDGTPTVAGEFPFTVQVRDSVSATATRNFNLTVNQPVGVAHLSASPTSLDFGNVLIGSLGSQTMTLTNSGSANLTLSQAQVSGTGFSTVGLMLPLNLTPGQSSTFIVRFAPLAAGGASGGISFISTAPDSPVTVSLSGSGTAPTSESIQLSWDASSSTVAGYNVYRSTVSGGPYTKLNSSLIVGLSYTDSTVQSGQTYYYVVTALDESSRESDLSNEAQVVIP